MIDIFLAAEKELFLERQHILRQNTTKTYHLIWGQCSPALQSQLMGDTEYMEKSTSCDCVWLLEALRLLSAGVDKHSNVSASVSSDNEDDDDGVDFAGANEDEPQAP